MEHAVNDFEAREDLAKMEARIVRKTDLRIMPWIIVCKYRATCYEDTAESCRLPSELSVC
jgi:hypothetical protein